MLTSKQHIAHKKKRFKFAERRKKEKSGFVPNSQYISSAIAEYLSSGGQINYVVDIKRTSAQLSKMPNLFASADDFLNG